MRAWGKEDSDKMDDKECQKLWFSRVWNNGKAVSIIGWIDGRQWLVLLDEEGRGETLKPTHGVDHKGRKCGTIYLKDENVDTEYKDIADRLIEKYGEYPTDELN